MYQFRFLVVGKFKEDSWRWAWSEYTKRLRPFARCEVVEIKETSFTSLSDHVRVSAEEGEHLLAKLGRKTYTIVLDRGGKELASEQFAEVLKTEGERGTPITFIIGGPVGLSPEVRHQAALQLSLGRLTLPHQLARIVLIEQVYRAMTILHGKRYHY